VNTQPRWKAIAAVSAAGLLLAGGVSGPADAASRASQARTAGVAGCRTLGRSDITAGRFLRDVRSARVQFVKAANLDGRWISLVEGSDDTIDGFSSDDGDLAGEGVRTLILGCQSLRVDFAAKWLSQLEIYEARQAAPAATAPPQVAAPAPRADPRNTATNPNLPLQNEGVPFNFPVPADFEPVASTLAGRTFRSKGVESTGAQLLVFERGCRDIGWPIIEKSDNQPYVLDGVASTGAGLVCRSPDGGGTGQPAPWRLRIVIVTVENRQVFNLWLTR
jgi:hypothetical protein